MKIGYARVSTEDQKLDLQLSALRGAGCKTIYSDHGISGSTMKRPGLEDALAALEPGETLVVWRLDRLGRSLTGLVKMIEDLGKRGVEFQSLTESINTASSGGRLVFHIMAALAEFERSLISERTKAGIIAAQQRGVQVGRPPSMTKAEVQQAWKDARDQDIGSIAERYKVSVRTLHRRFQELKGGAAN